MDRTLNADRGALVNEMDVGIVEAVSVNEAGLREELVRPHTTGAIGTRLTSAVLVRDLTEQAVVRTHDVYRGVGVNELERDVSVVVPIPVPFRGRGDERVQTGGDSVVVGQVRGCRAHREQILSLDVSPYASKKDVPGHSPDMVIVVTMTRGRGERPFRPQMPAKEWEAIAPYVHDVVARAEPLVTYSERELYPAVTRLVNFARENYMPFDDEEIWDPFTVERFVQFHLATYNRASRSTMRARLRRVSEALLGETAAVRSRALGKAEASRPYTSREIAILDGWAQSQRTVERRTSARALLALGLGAGLSGAEIISLKAGDVVAGDGELVVHVDGPRPRDIPLLAEWKQELQDRLDILTDDGWIFRSDQRGGNINLINDFVARSTPEVPLQTRRMRATWLAHHLTAGTPLKLLLRTAGLQSAEALDRVLPFID